MSDVASREKWSFRSVTVAAGGRLPTQRACPDCLGFRGGPRGSDGIAADIVSELRLPKESGEFMLATLVEVNGEFLLLMS